MARLMSVWISRRGSSAVVISRCCFRLAPPGGPSATAAVAFDPELAAVAGEESHRQPDRAYVTPVESEVGVGDGAVVDIGQLQPLVGAAHRVFGPSNHRLAMAPHQDGERLLFAGPEL